MPSPDFCTSCYESTSCRNRGRTSMNVVGAGDLWPKALCGRMVLYSTRLSWLPEVIQDHLYWTCSLSVVAYNHPVPKDLGQDVQTAQRPADATGSPSHGSQPRSGPRSRTRVLLVCWFAHLNMDSHMEKPTA